MKILLSIALTALGLSSLPAADAKKATLKEVASGFTAPIVLTSFPDEPSTLVVVDQIGTAHLLKGGTALEETLLLDLRTNMTKLKDGFDERGFLGLAFHPKFSQNRRLFAYYSGPLRKGAAPDWDHTSKIVEFKLAKGSRQIDLATEKVILEVDQPYFNHNGGALNFGPDGFLYIALGDGGNGNDEGRGHSPQGNGQDTGNLLGKILRIDVDSKSPYGIPTDNPLVGGGKGRPEIFAWGIRNPWGVSFDRGGNRELFVADVGQNMKEEINIVVKGGNYGWPVKEGTVCFNAKSANKPGESCPDKAADGKPFIPPIMEYKNFKGFAKDPEALGICVVGGHVYRGKALADLTGKYIFADWSRNWAKPDGVLFIGTRSGQQWSMAPFDLQSNAGGAIGAYVWAIGCDAEGELYFLTNDHNSLTGKTGKVHKLSAAN